MTTALAVFTRDLQLHDNPAPDAAVSTSAQVIPCFVIDDQINSRFRGHATRLAFLADSLADLDAGLRAFRAALVVRRGPWAETIARLARGAGASRIHVADDYSACARRRLAALGRAAGTHRIMRRLADGGIACNQLNWKWVTGTGTGTHRIFNPSRQGRRFDPGGDYIRRYVAELASAPA